jgi:hypothetical protein
MSRNPAAAVQCPICREPRRPREIIHGDLISEPLCKVIQAAHPEWSDQNVVCLSCLNHFRAATWRRRSRPSWESCPRSTRKW